MYEELCSKITELSGMPCKESKVIKGGVKKVGIAIGSGDIIPTVYPDQYSDMPIDDLARKLIDVVKNNNEIDKMEESVKLLFDWSWAKDHLQICVRPVIDAGDQIVKEFLDLQKYVRVILSKNASVIVTAGLLDRWKVMPSTVWECATAGEHRLMSMAQMLAGLMQEDEEDLDDGIGMYVITNDSRCHGANALLDDEILNMISDKMNGDYYILPSSIHELIVIPKNDNASVDELIRMVKIVNAEQVAPEDRLSNSVYLYHNGVLNIAA